MKSILLFMWILICIYEWIKVFNMNIYKTQTTRYDVVARLIRLRKRQIDLERSVSDKQLYRLLNLSYWMLFFMVVDILYWVVIIISLFSSLFYPLSVIMILLATTWFVIFRRKSPTKIVFILDSVVSGTIIGGYLFYLLN